MKIKFKIFKLSFSEEVTFAGYSDGYGKEYVSHPVLKASGFPPLQWDDYDTFIEAEEAIEKYGDDYSEYIIHQIYSK